MNNHKGQALAEFVVESIGFPLSEASPTKEAEKDRETWDMHTCDPPLWKARGQVWS